MVFSSHGRDQEDGRILNYFVILTINPYIDLLFLNNK